MADEFETAESTWDGEGRLTLLPAYYNRTSAVLMDVRMMDDTDATESEVAGWTEGQRRAAAEWSVSAHLAVTRPGPVIVPDRPAFIRRQG